MSDSPRNTRNDSPDTAISPRRTPGSKQAICFRGVAKHYGDLPALSDVNLDVPEGGCFGLLGPNGAGKTTAVGIAATLGRASAGRVEVLGRDVVSERDWVRRQIGIVFQEPCLDRELTAREHLQFHARLYRLKNREAEVEGALSRAGLADAADRMVREFSGGMARRLEIARGLMHRPRLLFLDEPTLGLDVAARRAVWDQIRELLSRDTTVFLTTHAMEEVEALCDRIAIIDDGRLVTEGSPDELKAALGGDLITLVLEEIAGAEQLLAVVDGVQTVDVSEGDRELRVVLADGSKRLAGLLDRIRHCGVVDVRMERPTLENVFLHHTGHDLTARGADELPASAPSSGRGAR